MSTWHEDMMNQAPMTAQLYMNRAQHIIDETFGDGYAKDNPELIAAFMVTCAIDYGATIVAKSIESLAPAILGHE